MKNIDIGMLKDKLGTLISILNSQLGIELSILNERIIISPYFDSFENAGIYKFIDDSYEKICLDFFDYNGSIYYKENKTELYWAGVQYINIFLNYQIPLKTIFLLMPLKEMVSKYRIYHEMNEKELCEDFIKNYYSKSIMKCLIDEEYTIRELSFLSGIPETTLKSLENNENLFKTSYNNVDKLATILNVSKVFFRKTSNCILYDQFLFNNDEFVDILKNNIKTFFRIKEEIQFVKSYEEIDSNGACLIISPFINVDISMIKKVINTRKVIIIVLRTCTIFKKSGKKNVISNVENKYSFIVKKTINEFLSTNRDNLLF